MIQLNDLQAGHTGFMMAYYQDGCDAVICASGLSRVFNVPPGIPIDISLSKSPRCSDSVRVVFKSEWSNTITILSHRTWTYQLPKKYRRIWGDEFMELFSHSYQYLDRFFGVLPKDKTEVQEFVGYITVYV